VPAFIQSGIDMSKVRQVETAPITELDRNSIAKVSDDDPYKVQVLSPDLYGPPILNHELTHTYQETRNKDLPSVSAPVTQSGRAAYDYGGIKGLQTALANRNTIADFNDEQQAEIVKDYKFYHDQYLAKAAQGKITPAEEKQMYDLQQAYHPFIQQLADMPSSKVNLDRSPLLELLGIQKPIDITGSPKPPGLPSYDTPGLGVLPADPLMGGKSQSTTPKNKQAQPSQVLQEVLQKYPGLSKTFNKDNTVVVLADPERSKRGLKERGGLEYWKSDDPGTKDFPSPAPGKNVIEIYSDDLKKNPELLKKAVYGDLMHGMSSDPYWKNLRDQFMQSFTPQELERQKQNKTWWDDVNKSTDRFGPTYDAYIRGYLANEGNGHQGQKDSGHTMYSVKQIQILRKMQDYLDTGESPKKQ
jgi:hypothetical protein